MGIPASGPGGSEAVQRRIRQAREQLLGGRGPGAGPLETARWKSERPSLGGRDPAAAREAVAEQTALARGEPGALVPLTARHSARLAASVRAVTHRVGQVRRRARVAVPAALAITGTVLALLEAGKLRGPSHRRPGQHPRSPRERGVRVGTSGQLGVDEGQDGHVARRRLAVGGCRRRFGV